MSKPRIEKFKDGYAILGETPSALAWISETDTLKFPLIVADPPYGNIVNVAWDRVNTDYEQFSDWMLNWTCLLETYCEPGGALYVFGGIGKVGFRPFFRYLIEAELQTDFKLSTLITWRKRRGYGIQHGYLFTREELAFFILGDPKKPRCFNVPYLNKLRGYAGYDADYPAKSEFLRRTNVWDDVTEILKGKIHDAQKPVDLIKIPIEAHTKKGEWVLDPFAGSGTTAIAARSLDRRFVVVEKDETEFEKLVARLRE